MLAITIMVNYVNLLSVDIALFSRNKFAPKAFTRHRMKSNMDRLKKVYLHLVYWWLEIPCWSLFNAYFLTHDGDIDLGLPRMIDEHMSIRQLLWLLLNDAAMLMIIFYFRSNSEPSYSSDDCDILCASRCRPAMFDVLHTIYPVSHSRVILSLYNLKVYHN